MILNGLKFLNIPNTFQKRIFCQPLKEQMALKQNKIQDEFVKNKGVNKCLIKF